MILGADPDAGICRVVLDQCIVGKRDVRWEAVVDTWVIVQIRYTAGIIAVYAVLCQ